METNQPTIKIIVMTLSCLAGLCCLTICIASIMAYQIPPELNNLMSGLVGLLGGMLVKTTPSVDPMHAQLQQNRAF